MIREYHRPTSLDEAVALAARPNTVVLGGGTVVNAEPGEAEAVVDLQGLELGTLTPGGDELTVGSMVTVQELADHPQTPAILRSLAERELPSALRGAATIGGTIAVAEPSSEFLTALLAHGASLDVVSSTGTGASDMPGFWGRSESAIITAVRVPTSGRTATDRTARTPRDQPIVCAAAHRTERGDVRLALGGVADRPVAVEPGAVAGLEPPADFRGSSDYRRHLASVLAGRVLAGVDGVR